MDRSVRWVDRQGVVQPYQMVQESCRHAFTNADLKAICKARGLLLGESPTAERLAAVYLTPQGVAEVLQTLSLAELRVLHLLHFLEHPLVDLNFWDNFYPSNADRYSTVTQYLKPVFEAVQHKLVRQGILLLAELPFAAETKIERWRYYFPAAFAPLLPPPLPTVHLENPPIEQAQSARAHLTQLTEQKQRPTDPLDYGVHLYNGSFYVGMTPLQLDLWRYARFLTWMSAALPPTQPASRPTTRADFWRQPAQQPGLLNTGFRDALDADFYEDEFYEDEFYEDEFYEDELDESANLPASIPLALRQHPLMLHPQTPLLMLDLRLTLHLLNQLPAEQWFKAQDFHTHYAPLLSGYPPTAKLSWLELLWQHDYIVRTEVQGNRYYRRHTPTTVPEPAAYLDASGTVNLQLIPDEALAALNQLVDFQRAGTRWEIRPQRAKWANADPALQTQPAVQWLVTQLPALRDLEADVAARRGKVILHQGLAVARISDNLLRAKLQQSLGSEVVQVQGEFLLFPQQVVPQVQNLLKKWGYGWRKGQSQ